MKNLSGTIKCLFVAIAVVAVVACATRMGLQSKRNVEFAAYYVAIHPDANVSDSDFARLNHALGRYQTFFYRIQAYRNGRLVKTRGTLEESALRNGLVTEVANKAKSEKFTGYALQAGREVAPKHPTHIIKPEKARAEESPSPSPTVAPSPSATPSVGPGVSTHQKFLDTEQQMMDELKPILAKYNK